MPRPDELEKLSDLDLYRRRHNAQPSSTALHWYDNELTRRTHKRNTRWAMIGVVTGIVGACTGIIGALTGIFSLLRHP